MRQLFRRGYFVKKTFCTMVASLLMLLVCLPALAASVTPVRFDGNDSNPSDYTPPAGTIHYEIPGSGTAGTYTVHFNDQGQVDPNGACTFTVTVGTATGKNYTQVLSWSSNFPVYAVIVKGGNAFNLYQYPTTTRSDTDLVSPNNASGHPADVSHVSIVFYPGGCSSSSQSSSSASSSSSQSSSSPSSSSCPPPPCHNDFAGIIFAALILGFLLIGIVIGILLGCCRKCHC